MACDHQHLLSAYHDGELDGSARMEMESHLASCPACAAQLAGLAELSSLFAAQSRPGMSQIARYRLHDRAETVMRADVLRVARAVQAIAACVLVGASIWLLRLPGATSQNHVEAASTVQSTPPWLDVAVTASAETESLDATSPAAAWYLADYTSRGDDWH